MKTWLKGGLIGLIISILTIPFAISKGPPDSNFLFLMLNYLLYPVTLITKLFPCSGEGCFGVALVVFPILTIIYGFIIGSIIGLIVSKIKSKK